MKLENSLQDRGSKRGWPEEGRRWRRLLPGPLLVVLLLILGLCVPFLLFYGSGQLPGDTAGEHYPFQSVALAAIHAGELPLWNPYAFGGTPLLAYPLNSLLYPSQLLLWLLPLSQAFALNQLLHVLFIAVGMYVLLRQHCDGVASAIGAFVFAAGGPVFFRLTQGQNSFLQALAWLPWIFVCLERFWARRQVGWVLALSGVLSLQFLGGFPTLSYYSGLTIGLYTLGRSLPLLAQGQWRSAAQAWAWTALALLLTAGLTGVQLLPTLEMMQRVGRLSPSLEFIQAGSLAPRNLITTWLPDIFGSPTTHTSINGANWGEHNLYIGAFPWLAVLITLIFFRQHMPAARRYLGMGAILFALALGSYNPLYPWLYQGIPGFRLLADLGRVTVFFTFCLAVAAAMCLQTLAARLPELSARARRGVRGGAMAATVALLAGLMILIFGRNWLSDLAAPQIARAYGETAGVQLGKLDGLYNTQAVSVGVLLVVILAGYWLLSARMRRRLGASAFMAWALALCVTDVGFYALRQSLTMRSAANNQPPDYVTYLKTIYQPGERLWPTNAMSFVNEGSRSQMAAITGYSSLISADYLDLLGILRGAPVSYDDRIPLVPASNSALLHILNVRYLVNDWPIEDDTLTLLYVGEKAVYRLPPGAVRAAIVQATEVLPSRDNVISRLSESGFDPLRTVVFQAADIQGFSAAWPDTGADAGDVLVEHESLNNLRLRVSADNPGWLVLGDSYYPGWKAAINGRPIPIYRANLSMRAIYVPSGEHQVSFIFKPDSLRYGLALSGVTLIMVAILVVWVGKRQWGAAQDWTKA